MKEFHPQFIERYTPLFSESEFATFLEYCRKPLRKALRVNTSRISIEDFIELAQKNEWILEKIPYIDSWFFVERDINSKAFWKSKEYFSWLFYIQETSSMIPPMVLNPKPGDIVLDVSAAPWSKTTQMANMMNNNWLVIANDIVQARINTMIYNIEYQWILNTAVSNLDWRDFWRYYEETFDKILLDAPCSWEWTMRKDDINWNYEVILELSRLQKKMIHSSLQALKVWWELVYSTCTLTPEEDEMIIDYVKQTFGDAIEVMQWELPWLKSSPWLTNWEWIELHPDCKFWHKVWPHINDTEWFFIAKFKKLESIDSDKKIYYERKNEEKILKSKEEKVFFGILEKRFWIKSEVFKDKIITKNWKDYRIRSKQSQKFIDFPNIKNAWISLWTEYDNKFLLSFYASQTFWYFATKEIVNIDLDQAEDFMLWNDIKLNEQQVKNLTLWQVIVKYENMILWASLLQKWWNIKNQVPRKNIKS